MDSTTDNTEKLRVGVERDVIECGKGPDHKGLPIVMVCLDRDCGNKRMSCLTCVDDLHCKHELISLRKFQQYISSTLNHNATTKNRDEIINVLKSTRAGFEQKINQVKSSFLQKIQYSLKLLDSHFESIQDTFMESKFKNVSEDLLEEFTEERVNHFYRLAKEAENNLVKSMNQINEVISSSQKVLDDRVSTYLKEIDKQSEALVKTINGFRISGKNAMKMFSFNPETKAASLILSNNNKTAKRGEGAGGYPIAVVDSAFTEENNEINFSVMEQPANKACWLGVCAINIVKNLNFQSCYGLGKGAWAIDQVGQNHVSAYTWSHHDSNFNSAPKVGFQFGIGDIINVKVNFEASKVIFTKNNTISYQQPIKLDLGPIHAFAGPTNLNDVLAIL